MTEQEALQVLRAHNAWRQFDGDDEREGPPMVDSRKVGEAIDVAIRVLEERAA